MRPAGNPSFEDETPALSVLLVPVALTSLPFVGARLHAFARYSAGEARGEAKEVHDLRLAVQEACANLIKHARIRPEDRRIIVRFDFDDDLLTVSVTDQAEPFDPRAAALTPPREEPSEGGYGLGLIRVLVDEVSYESQGGRNTLVLRKRLSPEARP